MVDFTILEKQRELIAQVLADVTQDEWFAIPAGRGNNLAWNLAHIVTVEQALTYGLSKQPMGIPKEYISLYSQGSSPAKWEALPDIGEFLGLLKALPPKTGEDYAAGTFAGYRPITTSTGVHLATVEEAIAFNNFHEGIHTGIMMSIKKELRSGCAVA